MQAFAAAVLRNPVLDLSAMIHLSDIPDWCYIEAFGTEVGRQLRLLWSIVSLFLLLSLYLYCSPSQRVHGRVLICNMLLTLQTAATGMLQAAADTAPKMHVFPLCRRASSVWQRGLQRRIWSDSAWSHPLCTQIRSRRHCCSCWVPRTAGARPAAISTNCPCCWCTSLHVHQALQMASTQGNVSQSQSPQARPHLMFVQTR